MNNRFPAVVAPPKKAFGPGPRLGTALFLWALAALLCFSPAGFSWLTKAGSGFAVAASAANLEKRLLQEQRKAEQRKQGLKRLTDQERKLNTTLADTEKKILETEKNLEDLQKRLSSLARTDAEAEAEYDDIQKRRGETLKAQSELMRLLWEIAGKRESVGGREMADWAVTDREYRWSKELLQELEAYHEELGRQQKELDQVLARRDSLSRQIKSSLDNVEKDKERLLGLRLSYSQQLSRVREDRRSAEEELNSILQMVDSLNLAIEKAGGDISRQQGKLPWPAKGAVKKKYAPGATPAFRGIGIATAERQPVQAVAAGKVVHNGVLRGLGTVLVLQHGEDYYTVYAYLSDSPLSVGKDVDRQDRIGTAGFFPDINGPGVYFELRFRQKAINPEQWLSAR